MNLIENDETKLPRLKWGKVETREGQGARGPGGQGARGARWARGPEEGKGRKVMTMFQS